MSSRFASKLLANLKDMFLVTTETLMLATRVNIYTADMYIYGVKGLTSTQRICIRCERVNIYAADTTPSYV